MLRDNSSDGFTLIELLVAVAIIGILASIAIPHFSDARIRATIAAVQTDFWALRYAIELYATDFGSYPMPSGRDTSDWGVLTSPVAYMHEVLYDRFLRKVINQSYEGARLFPYPYLYVASADTHNLIDVQLAARRRHKLKFDNYALASFGPDNHRDTDYLSYPRTTQFTTYSLSNGLRSRGDIHYESSPNLNDQNRKLVDFM